MKRPGNKKIRYGVVGLGYIAQIAVLPAFEHAKNSELTALISDDPVKLKKLAKKYNAKHTLSYTEYDSFLKSGMIDAVYIALPNSMHKDFTARAAKAGVHVLCEKPMAVTEKECEEMIEATEKNHVNLMIAYRLHFQKANMENVKLLQNKKIGEPRIFNSIFTMQVKAGDIRLEKKLGGGTLYDIGVYCINAARYLFKDEPYEVFAYSETNGEQRFKEVDEMTTAVLRFPKNRLATFTTSFGATDLAVYRVVGTKGDLFMEQAYEYAQACERTITLDGKKKKTTFKKSDQFAPELVAFSESILKNKEIHPSGKEGLADVRIVRALYKSAKLKRPVSIKIDKDKAERPSLKNVIQRPPISKPTLVHAASPHP